MFNCNCRWTELVLAVVILVFTLWPTQIFSATVSWWLVIIAAAILLLHAIFHHRCHCSMCMSGETMAAPRARSRRKRRR